MCFSTERLKMEERTLISIPPYEKNIPQSVYNALESVIWEEINKYDNPEEMMQPYEFPFENIQKIAESDNQEYKENIRNILTFQLISFNIEYLVN